MRLGATLLIAVFRKVLLKMKESGTVWHGLYVGVLGESTRNVSSQRVEVLNLFDWILTFFIGMTIGYSNHYKENLCKIITWA